MRHLVVLAATALLLALPRASGAVSIGVAGDSLSDEYQTTLHELPANAPSGTSVRYEGFNWVEQLAALRGADLGSYEADPSVRSDSRFDGYSQNWALKGQTAGGPTLLQVVSPIFAGQSLAGQVAGLEAQILANEVDVAVLMIGGNDLILRSLVPPQAQTPFPVFRDTLVASIVAAASVLDTAGAPVVVGGIPVAPDALGALDADILAINAALEAALPGSMIYVDPYAEVNARSTGTGFFVGSEFIAFGAAPSGLLVAPGDPSAVVPSQCGFAGTILPVPMTGPEGCPTAAYQRFHVQDDGIHPTTVTQGLMANALLAGINSHLMPEEQLALLDDGEILAIAGLPEPAPLVQAVAALFALIAWRVLGVGRRPLRGTQV